MYYGWYVVMACGALAFWSWGLGFYGLGVYLIGLREVHGWTAGTISLAVTAYYLLTSVIVIRVGSLIDRHGPRPLLTAGALAMATSVALLGFVSAIWQLFAVYLLLSIGWACLGSTGISGTLLPWFQRRRGLALTLALSGPSVGGLVLIPLLVASLGRYGFRATMLGASLLFLATVLPLVAFVIRRRPQDLGLMPDGGPVPADAASTETQQVAERAWRRADALRSPLFWTNALPFSLGIAAQVGFLVHQIAFLEPSIGRASAAFAVSATTVAALVGRLLVGFRVDATNLRLVSAGIFLLQGIALVLMATVSSPVALFAGSIALGLGVGNMITLPPLLVQREFGGRSFGMVFAMVFAGMQVGIALAPGAVGLLRDAWGGYEGTLWVLAGMEAVALAAIVWGRALGVPTRSVRHSEGP